MTQDDDHTSRAAKATSRLVSVAKHLVPRAPESSSSSSSSAPSPLKDTQDAQAHEFDYGKLPVLSSSLH